MNIVKIVIIILCLIMAITTSGELLSNERSELPFQFSYSAIDRDSPLDPWCKTIGDINGDKKIDIVIGGHSPKKPNLLLRLLNKLKIVSYEWPTKSELVWYENPSWSKHIISKRFKFRTDAEIADLDMDGDSDVVALTDDGIVLFKNPNWSATVLDRRKLHDIEIADFDNDGRLDLVARDQGLFGNNSGDKLHFYKHEKNLKMIHIEFMIPQGEGLKVADMDNDGYQDVVVNFFWYKNPGVLSKDISWEATAYCEKWTWPDVFIDVADINKDGHKDVILSPAEKAHSKYHLSWCQAPNTEQRGWIEHIVAKDIEAVHHSVHAKDFDLDGYIDILTAQMKQGNDPDEVSIYFNNKDKQLWEKQVISIKGSHSMRVMDVDNDGDLDFYGANWSKKNTIVDLWINKKKSP